METKMYSREDLMKVLVNRLKEELTDVDTYNSLYESFKAHGMYEEAAEIEEIARDEFTHAEALYDILKEHGYDLHADQEITSLWHRAKSVFHIM
jgi:ferritin